MTLIVRYAGIFLFAFVTVFVADVLIKGVGAQWFHSPQYILSAVAIAAAGTLMAHFVVFRRT